MVVDKFSSRHIGPRGKDIDEMLAVCGAASLDQLIEETIPSKIRLNKELDLDEALTEYEYLGHIKALASKINSTNHTLV